jgi:hypothetical protein
MNLNSKKFIFSFNDANINKWGKLLINGHFLLINWQVKKNLLSGMGKFRFRKCQGV